MGDISTECGYVADLGPSNQVAGFGQCLGVRANQWVENDPIDRHSGADEELIPSSFETGQLFDGSYIQQGVDGSMPALFQVEQKIRSTRNRENRTRRLGKGL
jgi:hypothetical protein